ncbi:MAG: sulfurtransferase TusA family protein [Chloroflexi bacterium]|nr:sulfurtransferase TusA family protein [Chloroflexota bacterium]
MDGTVLSEDKLLDCSGMLCPLPIIKVSKEVKAMQLGQVLKMIATDPGSMADMEAWARQTGNELLDARQDGKTYTFFIRKKK